MNDSAAPSNVALRTKVRADFKIWGTLFSAPLFSGLNQWFRPKTIWGTHQTGSQRSKRPFFDFFKIFFEKSWFFRQKTKGAGCLLPSNSKSE